MCQMKFKPILYVVCMAVLALGAHAQKQALTDSQKNSTIENKSAQWIRLAHQATASNPDSALLFLDQAVRDALSDEMKGKAFFEKALLYRYLGKNIEQSHFLDTAYTILAGVNDSIAADVMYYQQMLLGDKGRYKEALQTGHRQLEIRRKLSSRDKELNAILQIGYTYDRMGEYHKAIEWYEKGFNVEGVKNEDYIGRNYGLIGIAYDELKDYEKAVSYNLQAIAHFEHKPNSVYLHTWYSNIGNTYIKMGKLDLAEKYTLLALEDSRKKRYVTQINLGKIYIEKGQMAKAENLLKKVLEELLQTDHTIFLSEAYDGLHELYRKKGDFRTALTYYEKYKTNEDERLSIAKAKQLNELTIQYETAEKERQILVQRAKIADHQLALKNRSFWIFGLGALAVIVGLIGFLLYKQQALKNIKQQKDNELKLALEKIESQDRLQEQRLAISRDLHDNIGAHLTFIISSIDTLKQFMANRDMKLSDRLGHMSSFAKDTIRELRDTIWAMNKSHISIEDLKLRIANFIGHANQTTTDTTLSFADKAENSKGLFFNSKTGMNIYRILQEAVNNALKHADATRIDISFVQQDDELQMQVADNGNGFDTEGIYEGSGLRNMKNRVETLGGMLEITSLSGQTVVACRFPPREISETGE